MMFGQTVPKVSEADLLAVLASAGSGLTSLEVAQRLNARANSMNSRLGRLADYGKIRRERISLPGSQLGGRNTYCIWHSLPPSTVTSSGPGETGPVEQGNRLDRAPLPAAGGLRSAEEALDS